VREARAAVGSVVFLVLAPGVVAGLVPWLLTDWEVEEPIPHWLPLRIVGLALLGIGVVVLLDAFARFVREGLGTPAPVAPTEHLVVGGLYRYVRNPMYLAVASIIVGQALLLGQLVLLVRSALRARRVGVHPLVRGADAASPVRRRVRRVPALGAGLVAAPDAVAQRIRTPPLMSSVVPVM
jgi:hypothetical protein